MFTYEKLGNKKYKITCLECGNVKYTTSPPHTDKCSALTCGEQFYKHNYIGKTFGDMTIISKEDDKFIIKCNICGFITKVRVSNFINNTFNNQSHSNCHKILYKQVDNVDKFQNFKERWRTIIRRCCDKNHKSYEFYSKIGVCEKWKDFMFFYNDMYKDFKPELQIDRIDGEKSYCKENCRWVTAKKNAINRKTTKNAIAYNVLSKKIYKFDKNSEISILDFSKLINVSSTNIYDRLNKKIKNIPQNNFIFFNNEKELEEYIKKTECRE